MLQSLVKDEPCLVLLTYKVTQEITEIIKQFRTLLVYEDQEKSRAIGDQLNEQYAETSPGILQI